MKPEDVLKLTEGYAKSLSALASSHVAVGLPKGQGSKNYGDKGVTTLQVGAWHEFGTPNLDRRSFLRVPFKVKKKELNAVMDSQVQNLLKPNADAGKLLGIIGVTALNISRGAFTTMGYGQWPDILQSTKTAKGKSQPLIDTGLLRGSITFEVRNAP